MTGRLHVLFRTVLYEVERDVLASSSRLVEENQLFLTLLDLKEMKGGTVSDHPEPRVPSTNPTTVS